MAPHCSAISRPWFSTLSIDKGSRPLDEIAKALDSIEIGISCLTPENLTAPWLLYEAGALSKRIGTKSRLCTYLLSGLGPEGVPPPLGMFQHSRSDKEETKHMLRSINIAISEDPVPESALDKLFERMWPDLEQSIKSMPAPDSTVVEKRTTEDMFAEILSYLRAEEDNKGLWFIDNHGFVADPAGPDKKRISLIPVDYKNAQVPESKWKAALPNCPDCGSPGIIQDMRTLGKYCPTCGATNGLPVRS